VTVRDHVTGYQRKLIGEDRVLETVALDLPEIVFETEAIWIVPAKDTMKDFDEAQLLGSLHAAEHAMIGLLPLLCMCDRNDIGGLSTNWHRDIAGEAIFIYDGHPGGAGLVHGGFDMIDRWVRATLDTVRLCPCADGCPSCVQSPKCGNLNEHLDKRAAIEVLDDLADDGTTRS
jgi:DEAD/DEAH box helicase domain-containing protein